MHITVEGKQYEIPEKMTLGEASLIKSASGLSMRQLQFGLEVGDPDLIAALIVIVMRRSGRNAELGDVYEMDVTEIDFGGAEEADDGPPAESPAGKSGTTRKQGGTRRTAGSSK